MSLAFHAARGALFLLLWPALIAGCAAPGTHERSRALLRAGEPLQALALADEAARSAPDSLAHRATLLRMRELAAAALLREADEALRTGDEARAERVLRQLQASGLADAATADRRRRLQDAPREAASEPSPADAAPADPALAAALRKPITLEFREAPLRSVFDLLARGSGLNFVFDKDVRTDQKTSIFLRDATVEAAVQRILLVNQLEHRVLDANTLLVYPATAAKQKDYQPLVVRAFYLAHAEAKSVAASLKTLLKGREIVVDDKLNLLVLRDSAEAVALAGRLIALHDIPEPEVMLEVEILEVKRTRLMDLGVRWPDQLTLTPLAAAAGTPLTLEDLRGLDSRSIGATVAPLVLNARRTEGDANILANPRIRARNREKARILIGERVPNITATSTATGFVAESVTYVDVGLKLDVEPTVHLDGDVAMKVALEVSNIINQLQTKSGSIAYQIGTRSAQTVLRLKDGENQVLAGLINDEDRRTANRVPGLGSVPVLGRLFGSQADDHSKTEIVLSITPRVLRSVQRPAAPLLQFDSGTENQIGAEWLGRSAAAPAARRAEPAATAASAARAAEASSTPASPSAAPAQAPLVPATAPPAPPTPLRLGWSGPDSARPGELVAVHLHVEAALTAQRMPITLAFDPRALQLVSVTPGPLLEAGAALGGRLASRIDPAGQVLLTLDGPAPVGQGSLAVLGLRVVSAEPGLTQLRLLHASAQDPAGASLAVGLPAPHALRILPAGAAATASP